jgi:hypothetical protein
MHHQSPYPLPLEVRERMMVDFLRWFAGDPGTSPPPDAPRTEPNGSAKEAVQVTVRPGKRRPRRHRQA